MTANAANDLPIAAQIEGLLFVAAEAVAPSQLAEALDVSVSTVDVALNELEATLGKRGLRLQRHGGKVQHTTAPELAGVIEQFLGLEATSRLSRAALETLAIIAYQQPITHPQIDAIRGVNSDSMLKSLLTKGLIYEVGRAEAALAVHDLGDADQVLGRKLAAEERDAGEAHLGGELLDEGGLAGPRRAPDEDGPAERHPQQEVGELTLGQGDGSVHVITSVSPSAPPSARDGRVAGAGGDRLGVRPAAGRSRVRSRLSAARRLQALGRVSTRGWRHHPRGMPD